MASIKLGERYFGEDFQNLRCDPNILRSGTSEKAANECHCRLRGFELVRRHHGGEPAENATLARDIERTVRLFGELADRLTRAVSLLFTLNLPSTVGGFDGSVARKRGPVSKLFTTK